MNQPLLSVIVPCYNVEKHIDKCITSIVGQTYSNLEILLIDDGSSDNSGTICDAWQERDSRIKIIHKQNEGASLARKTGIENATAEYVTFVDADDWIDVNMYSNMMAALLSTNSDIADCDLCFVHDDGYIGHRVDERHADIKIMGRAEGVIMILENHRWRTSFGTKVFKKKLFDHVKFPKERVYGEDMIVHDLFHNASQSVFLDREYYFYYQRNDSISHGNMLKEMKNFSDFSDAYYERYSFVKKHPEYHSTMPTVKYTTMCLCIGLLRNMISCPQYFTGNCFMAKSKQLRSIPYNQEDKKRLRYDMRRDLFVIRMNPLLYKILRTIYSRVIQVTNKLKITNRQTCYCHYEIW